MCLGLLCCSFKCKLASFAVKAVCIARSNAAAKNNPITIQALTGIRAVHRHARSYNKANLARSCAMCSRLIGIFYSCLEAGVASSYQGSKQDREVTRTVGWGWRQQTHERHGEMSTAPSFLQS